MAENGEKSNGWNEWSKHVLKELERLNNNYENLGEKIDSIKGEVREEISDIKTDITKVKAMGHTVDEIKAWKKSYEDAAVLKTQIEVKEWKAAMDEVASPTQVKELTKKVETLDKFKTQAVTIFLVAQALVGIALAIIKFYE